MAATVSSAPAVKDMDPLDCVINPSVVADLGSGVPGILSDIRVDRSDFVKAGDVVARLDSGVESAALELARARAELDAEVDLRKVNAAFGNRQNRRTMDLFHRKAISTNDMDQRRTEARIAQIQLRQAEDNKDLAQLEKMRAEEILKRRTIKSPIDGVVMERFKVVGEYVEEKPVVRIAKVDPLHVEVIVPVEQLGKIKNGMRAEVWSETVEGQTWYATVSRVDPVADVASGTYGVRLTMPNPDNRIPAGLRCRMQLVGGFSEPTDQQTAAVEPAAEESRTAEVVSQGTEGILPAPVDVEKPLPQPQQEVVQAAQGPAPEVKKAVVDEAERTVASLEAEARKVRVALPDLVSMKKPVGTVEKAPQDKIKPIRRVLADSKPKHTDDKAAEGQSVAPVALVEEAPMKVATPVSVQEKPAQSKPEPIVQSPAASPEVAEVDRETDIQPMDPMPGCRLAGPYADEVMATRQVVNLRKGGLYADIKSVNTYKRAGYKIVTPLQKSRADMNAIAARLKAAGFTDYYVPRKKSSPKRVILGLYKGKRMAQLKIDKLEKKGFTVELLPWKKKESQHYLVIRGVPNTSDNGLLAGLPVPDSNGESAQSFCNHLAGR